MRFPIGAISSVPVRVVAFTADIGEISVIRLTMAIFAIFCCSMEYEFIYIEFINKKFLPKNLSTYKLLKQLIHSKNTLHLLL